MESKSVDANRSICIKERNLLLRDSFEKNQKDFLKRKKLRELRLQQIDSYRDEQIAALK